MDRTSAKASALDVAEYILGRLGQLDGWKLQKLVCYSQAWSAVWRDSALFRESVQAWVHGPVVSELYQMHSGQKAILTVGGHAEHLEDEDRATIDEVLLYYGEFDGKTLRKQSHNEQPWKSARGNLPENQPSTAEITVASMRAFYASRPCGCGSPVTDLSLMSSDRVEKSRKQLAAGEWVGLESLASVPHG